MTVQQSTPSRLHKWLGTDARRRFADFCLGEVGIRQEGGQGLTPHDHLGVVAHGAAQALERVLLLHAVVQQPQRGAPGGQEVLQVGRDLQGGGLEIGRNDCGSSGPQADAKRDVLLGAWWSLRICKLQDLHMQTGTPGHGHQVQKVSCLLLDAGRAAVGDSTARSQGWRVCGPGSRGRTRTCAGHTQAMRPSVMAAFSTRLRGIMPGAAARIGTSRSATGAAKGPSSSGRCLIASSPVAFWQDG